jgi:tetratricopeptide (TPR) repeat protein
VDYDWDWVEAESEFKRAIRLDANSATAHQWYGDFLTRMGRFEEAGLELKKAQELDPLSSLTNTIVGRQLYFARRYREAIEQLQKTLERDPKFVPAHNAIESAYAQNESYGEAIAERQKVFTLAGAPDLASAVGQEQGKSGYAGVLQGWLEGRHEVSKRAYVSAYNMAEIYARLEQKEEALASLERAYKGARQQAHVHENRACLRRDPLRSAIPTIAASVRLVRMTSTNAIIEAAIAGGKKALPSGSRFSDSCCNQPFHSQPRSRSSLVKCGFLLLIYRDIIG